MIWSDRLKGKQNIKYREKEGWKSHMPVNSKGN